ncbi:LOW QUALITY PROTEIN: hypothetical protein QTO34_014264 [Cnephaeus nilssonii]|uniref:Uncharacterized protein n=1 Tax=Cnephaeus nilssonii TaxID=3371016 RepID=A0AA40LRQ9_CNENI|nr:LOW QUALITY PROTEIN: hypothetical protein QTO34_014264 [Eptesicus nilssonii]
MVMTPNLFISGFKVQEFVMVAGTVNTMHLSKTSVDNSQVSSQPMRSKRPKILRNIKNNEEIDEENGL